MARNEHKPVSSQSYQPLSQESAALEDEDPATIGTWSNSPDNSLDQNGESSVREKKAHSDGRRGNESQRSSMEANEPLLSDSEDDGTLVEEEKTSDDPKEEEKKSFSKAEYTIALSHFIRIFSYSTWNDRLLLFVASAASICTGVTLPLMNVVFGQLVGAFSGLYDPAAGETKEMFLEIINQNVLYMIYLFIGRLGLDYIAMLGFRISSIRISAAVRLSYLQALFKQPLSVLDTLPQGQTAAIITVTGNILQLGISEKLSTFLQSTSLVITALLVAFHYSWLLTLVTSSGLLFIVVFYACTIPRLVRMMKEVEHADRMSSSLASEAFSSVRMVAACGAEGKMAEAYAGWVKESRRRGLLMSPLVAIQQAPVFFAIHATFALSFWYAIKLYTEFQITSVATIIIVLMSIMTIVMSIGSISAPVTAAVHAAGAASIFFSIIDAPQPKSGIVKAPEVSSQEDIVLENINFAYPLRHEVKVLDNLSVRFPAGKLTAIVGASGSGKSTIVGLIERWYEMDGNMTDNMLTLFFRNGTIKVGDRNLHEIDLKWWRSQIGLVQQEPFLFNDTIFKNVEYGLIGTEWECDTDEEKMRLVRRACKEAFADEFITRLPEGYDTLVGDAGIKLSGGQRQRIAIARSIVKRPKILILDEATSAIDVRGERIVQAALDKVSKGRTTITIAHRLSTIVKADNIVVLKKGQVVQQGTHEQLMTDEEGPYWALANAQKLSLGADSGVGSSVLDPEKGAVEEEVFENISMDAEDFRELDAGQAKSKGYLGSFMLFLWEQKSLWAWYSLMLAGALGAGAAFPAHSYLFAKLISLFNLWGQYLKDQTSYWCLMFFLLALGVFVSYYAVGYGSNTISFNITAKYRQEYFQNTLAKPVSYHDSESNSVGALTARMASDPVQLQQLLGINMAIVLISLFNISGSIALSFFFGWKLALITVITAVPVILAAGFFRIRHETQFEKMNNEVFEESSKFATESIGAFRTVSSLVLEDTICGRYEKLLREHSENAFKKAKFSTLVFAMSDSISLLCMALVLWYGGQLLADHEYTPFNYLVVYLAVVQGSTSAGQSLSFGPNIAQAFAAASRIRSMRAQDEPESSDLQLDLEDSEDDEKGRGGVKIELKNVWFKYPTRDVPVLQGLNMTIEKGQFAAIVGPSGCGKTSIISLLERFYSAQSGQILLQSTDISTTSLSSYRSYLSLVSQEPSLFEGTIRSNILLGLPSSTPNTSALLERACREAEIHDFISSLPEGYSTPIGPKGIALSGGQKQRLALARALIRNPRVLLLDEATSNLDSETERAVQGTLERTGKGRTMVVVAHRLATVQNADIIFVVSEGRVVEKGDHGSLLKKRGVYWQMCQSQALDR